MCTRATHGTQTQHIASMQYTDTSFEEVVVVVALKNSAGELRGAGPAMQ